MNVKINDIVKLKFDLPQHNLRQGAVGVVVMNFIEPREGYRVEFVEIDGKNSVEVNLAWDQIEKYQT